MSALSPRLMFLLDEACRPIRLGLRCGVYLVGTATARGGFRDVDVRAILVDGRYDELRQAVGPAGVAFLGLAIGQYLASRTGLPVDFQIQRQTDANARHSGVRNPLGVRSLGNYAGDGGPAGVPGEAAE